MTYDTLVLGGSSTNAILTLGALQLLYEANELKDVVNYIGTSSGSILSLLLCVGYSPIDIICRICCEKAYGKIGAFNISNVFSGKGLMTFDAISSFMSYMIVEKLGYVPTLDELTPNLTCVTYNVTDDAKEYVNRTTYPNLSVVTAARMSCTFPVVFEPFEYEGKQYIDGGIIDNFAIDYAELVGTECLGIIVENTKTAQTGNMDLLYKLVEVYLEAFVNYKVSKSANCKVYKLKYPANFFNFKSSDIEIIKLFDSGYELLKNQIKI